ncbi:MAG: helix-turn-helix domain-containing protein [Pararhodobacter sp.]|nr:helix-turn-helix domain-containing protein [Pararhodobacter sp.]
MTSNLKPLDHLPDWVPAAVRLYLSHTENGRSLRDIARSEGMHASTVLRQVRRFESRRDDPLVDCALERLLQRAGGHECSETKDNRAMTSPTIQPLAHPPAQLTALPATGAYDTAQMAAPSACRMEDEARRVLRRMAEPGAFLAVAADMERAVVLRDGPEGAVRLAVLDRPVAEVFALREWISCRKPGRVAQYEITPAGRAMLRRLLADADMAEGAEPQRLRNAVEAEGTRARAGLGESPVTALARRRDRDGKPFLTPDLVSAAEKLREDFEIAQMGPSVTQDWERFLTGNVRGGFGPGAPGDRGQRAARERVERALSELGPGLGDMALRCCCYLEGLETAEQKLGWSARSGKIVLRIALTRLKRYYDAQGEAVKLIG